MSGFWLYQHSDWLGGAETNRGRLLTPPVLVDALPKTTKWGLLVWNPGRCGPSCRRQLNKITRIRLALGRRFYNVNLWVMTHNKTSFDAPKTVGLIHQQGIQPVILPATMGAKLPILGDTPSVFIVNPDNFLILSYQLAVDPADIYSDLQRVMNLQRSL